MKTLQLIAAIIVLAFTATPALAEEAAAPEQQFNWQYNGDFTLSDHATVKVDGKHAIVTGDEAKKLLKTISDDNDVEGVEGIYVGEGQSFVVFESVKEGFVRFNDWDKIDAAEMLKGIQENVDANNAKHPDLPPLVITGWLKEPTLNKETNEVTWAIGATQNDKPLINTTTIVFGRHGYEKLTLVADSQADEPLLADAKQAFTFTEGSRYSDFKDGDKVAAYGAGALVATVAGAKVAAKLGLLAIALGFLKKAGFLVLLVPAFFRKLFKKKAPDVQ